MTVVVGGSIGSGGVGVAQEVESELVVFLQLVLQLARLLVHSLHLVFQLGLLLTQRFYRLFGVKKNDVYKL